MLRANPPGLRRTSFRENLVVSSAPPHLGHHGETLHVALPSAWLRAGAAESPACTFECAAAFARPISHPRLIFLSSAEYSVRRRAALASIPVLQCPQFTAGWDGSLRPGQPSPITLEKRHGQCKQAFPGISDAIPASKPCSNVAPPNLRSHRAGHDHFRSQRHEFRCKPTLGHQSAAFSQRRGDPAPASDASRITNRRP